jgi:hypothetical protein
MDDLIARVVAETGVDSDTANKAAGTILAFLRKEGPPDDVSAVFAALPGAAEAADAAVDEDSGVAMGGGLMGLAGQLTGLGLGMADMQTIGRHVLAYVREKAGDDHVGQIVSAIPGLGQFL